MSWLILGCLDIIICVLNMIIFIADGTVKNLILAIALCVAASWMFMIYGDKTKDD